MPPSIPPFRVGLGFDSHRLGNGGPLRIGGIDVPAEVHAIGHSDADVLLHAITDAILGSVAEAGYRPTVSRQRSAESSPGQCRFSARGDAAVAKASNGNRQFGLRDLGRTSQDGTPYRFDEGSRSADWLMSSADRISIKAKTGEGIGPIGHAEAIAARVVVLVFAS